MIVKKHTKQDQHYAGTALLIGRRAYRVAEEEKLILEETDHKAEEEDVTIKGETEVEEEDVITKDIAMIWRNSDRHCL